MGKKHTVSIVYSNFGRTYSYIEMPLILMNDELKGKMFSCMRESIGKFEPAVSKHLFMPPNLYITCWKWITRK